MVAILRFLVAKSRSAFLAPIAKEIGGDMLKEGINKVRAHVNKNPIQSILTGLAVPLIIWLASFVWSTNNAQIKMDGSLDDLQQTVNAQWKLIKELTDKVDHPDDFKALVGNRDKKDEPLDSFIDHKKAGQKSEKVLR
jgi:hypothetical protein